LVDLCEFWSILVGVNENIEKKKDTSVLFQNEREGMRYLII